MARSNSLTGYGPSNQWQNLTFDGDKRKFELWETKILGYMKLKKLKDVLVSTNQPSAEKNEQAFAELIQFLDERSFSLVMRDARDDGREVFRILREHYARSGKPRIITLYNQLTTLQKRDSETMTDYILRAETASKVLKTAEEIVSDALLVAIVLKGLPDDYRAFVAVINQSDTVQNFQKFKQALRNFEETEKTRISKRSDDNSIFKAKVDCPKAKSFNCYNCGLVGHKAADCRKLKEKKWCYYCKSTTHSDKVCRKLKDRDKAKKAVDDNAEHSFIFKVSDDEMYLAVDNETFSVDCGATTHIVNKDENFIHVNPSFKPEEHFIELADGTQANNVAKKRVTVAVSMRTENGNIVQATLENALFIPTDILNASFQCKQPQKEVLQ